MSLRFDPSCPEERCVKGRCDHTDLEQGALDGPHGDLSDEQVSKITSWMTDVKESFSDRSTPISDRDVSVEDRGSMSDTTIPSRGSPPVEREDSLDATITSEDLKDDGIIWPGQGREIPDRTGARDGLGAELEGLQRADDREASQRASRERAQELAKRLLKVSRVWSRRAGMPVQLTRVPQIFVTTPQDEVPKPLTPVAKPLTSKQQEIKRYDEMDATPFVEDMLAHPEQFERLMKISGSLQDFVFGGKVCEYAQGSAENRARVAGLAATFVSITGVELQI